MKNIFATTKEYVQQPNRNVFDLSFQNNGTYNFGTLYPVFCKEVIPGDSFKIDTQFALRFLPMAFPIQTRMRANLHYFYVRNRNLWDDWKKFIGHTAETEPPFLDGSQDCFKTGGLADYLGIPTTLVGNYSRSEPTNLITFYTTRNIGGTNEYVCYQFKDDSITVLNALDKLFSGSTATEIFSPNLGDSYSYTIYRDRPYIGMPSSRVKVTLATASDSDVSTDCFLLYMTSDLVPKVLVQVHFNTTDYKTFTCELPYGSANASYYFYDDLGVTPRSFDTVTDAINAITDALGSESFCLGLMTDYTRQNSFIPYSFPINLSNGYGTIDVVTSYDNDYSDITDLTSDKNPFVVSNDSSIPISALPFRAYESIYNAFYRNEQNDPLMIDGQPEYDKYCPNTTSGSDSFPYKLYNRNWELDYLTSAVQSPQQGIAPLVGVSQSGDFTFVNRDSNGYVGYFTAKANLSSDGQSITGFQLSDNVELSDIPLTETPNSDVPDSVKRGTVYTLNQMALAGISINDFRNVNALQRWLETNIRRGYKYVDQIKSHFGVDVAYNVLDMPEFIGGVSEPVYINQVNQTTETETDPLGSYAGQASVMASSNHPVTHYCDEHGFIIGIFSVVPVPNYSQLLPKHFIKDNYLDYFFPEFGHIGMQPIDYREVCPLQQYGVNPSGLNDTFGYQRAWYDYISSVDEIHGLFRTNLRNFVLNRQFDTLPRLNKDFLQVDASQLNDVFTVQDISDKILGQIHFNVIAKRPIPKFGIPRLE